MCSIGKKDTTRYLGIEIDKNWNFKPHISQLIKKTKTNYTEIVSNKDNSK